MANKRRMIKSIAQFRCNQTKLLLLALLFCLINDFVENDMMFYEWQMEIK